MRHPAFGERRARLLSEAAGECLEIGIGTGRNLAHYPKHVERLRAVEPSPGMRRRLARHRGGPHVDVAPVGAERLPYDDQSFDTVVSTLTFCTIADLPAALGEMNRVLKPGGRVLFLEHGLSPDQRVARWQRRLDPIQHALAGGCRLSVDVARALDDAGFNTDLRAGYADGLPKVFGYVYEGRAFKAHRP